MDCIKKRTLLPAKQPNMKKPKDLIILEKKLGVTLQEGAMATILDLDSRNTYALDQKGQLIGLNLRGNHITDLAPLSKLTGLQYLDLSSNHITDLTPLSEFTGLQKLYLWYNQITDIRPLKNLK